MYDMSTTYFSQYKSDLNYELKEFYDVALRIHFNE